MYNMRSNNGETTPNEERLKDFQRKQDTLRTVPASTDKVKSLSAEVMIENFLKENLIKSNSTIPVNNVNSGAFPDWLECESSNVPGLYKQLWTYVKCKSNFADTHKVSQLLLTSGLPLEVLGLIWNLSNKMVPGQLNKQEFYIVLALVALAQLGYKFNNLSILNSIPSAPVPSLQTTAFDKYKIYPSSASHSTFNQTGEMRCQNEENFKVSQLSSLTYGHSVLSVPNPLYVTSAINEFGKQGFEAKTTNKVMGEISASHNNRDFSRTSNFPLIGSSPTAELDDDFSEFQSVSVSEINTNVSTNNEGSNVLSNSDEFTDFQCADIDPLKNLASNQKKEIPKIPLPKNLSGRLTDLRTNILKISPENDEKLKVLSPTETSFPSLPESKISTSNKVSTMPMPNISVLGGRRDIGMRLANHTLGSKLDRSKYQRHHKQKQILNIDDIPSVPTNESIEELFPKCLPKNVKCPKTFILKETKIGNVDAESNLSSTITDKNVNLFSSGKTTRKIEIPMLGTFNETVLPAQADTFGHNEGQTVELFSVEEDKYSALREVELEMKLKGSETQKMDAPLNFSDEADDFGEFLSVDLPSSGLVNDLDEWGKCNNQIQIPSEKANEVFITNKPSEYVNELKFESYTNKSPKNESKPGTDLTSVLNFDLLSLEVEDNSGTRQGTVYDKQFEKNEDPFRIVTNGTNDNDDKKLENCEDFQFLNAMKNEENCNGSTVNNLTTSLDDFNMKTASEDFGIFFTSDCNPTCTETQINDMPSLDLNVLSGEAPEQDMRKKCLTACLNLIQQGINILSAVTSPPVLEEVFSTEEVVQYLNNLNIILHISRRISANYKEYSSIQEEIERLWQKIINFCYEYNVKLKEDVESIADMTAQCHVCMSSVGYESINRGMNYYHPSCANFWINCVDSNLPCPI